MTPKVVSVKFTSNDHAEALVRRYADNQNFPYKYENCLCSDNQTPEERAYYKHHLEVIFKVKRTIYAYRNIDVA